VIACDICMAGPRDCFAADPVTWAPDDPLRLSDRYAPEALYVADADLSGMASQGQGLSDVCTARYVTELYS